MSDRCVLTNQSKKKRKRTREVNNIDNRIERCFFSVRWVNVASRTKMQYEKQQQQHAPAATASRLSLRMKSNEKRFDRWEVFLNFKNDHLVVYPSSSFILVHPPCCCSLLHCEQNFKSSIIHQHAWIMMWCTSVSR
jgi:hypothetical protein